VKAKGDGNPLSGGWYTYDEVNRLVTAAEVRIQTAQPGAPTSKPFGWRTRDVSVGPEWVEGTVCAGCQVYPRELFAPGTRGAPGGPWGD
jgi:hypothetical protein